MYTRTLIATNGSGGDPGYGMRAYCNTSNGDRIGAKVYGGQCHAKPKNETTRSGACTSEIEACFRTFCCDGVRAMTRNALSLAVRFPPVEDSIEPPRPKKQSLPRPSASLCNLPRPAANRKPATRSPSSHSIAFFCIITP